MKEFFIEMLKKISAVILVTIMIIGISPTNGFAECEEAINHIFETIDENNINITDYSDGKSEDYGIMLLALCDEHIDEDHNNVCDICSDDLYAYILHDGTETYYTEFATAINEAHDGDTVYLLRDAVISSTVTLSQNITIASEDENAPCQITTKTKKHGYLLNITDKNVTLKNIIVDGGSQNSLTATRAMVAVNGGTLTIGEGTVIRNNNNTTSQGVGGGICVISGYLYINGGRFEGNSAYFGGGVGLVGGMASIKNSTFSDNYASIGGGICVWEVRYKTAGTLILEGNVTVTNNEAKYYAGGIDCNMNGKISITGYALIENNISGEEENSGIYLDGNDTDGRSFVYMSGIAENTRIRFCSYNPPLGTIAVSPMNDYTITKSDLAKLSYESKTLGLKLYDDGTVRIVCLHNHIDENGKCTDCNDFEVPIKSVSICEYKESLAYEYEEEIKVNVDVELSDNADIYTDIQWFVDGEKWVARSHTFILETGTHEIYCIATNNDYSVKSNVICVTVNAPANDGNENRAPQTGDSEALMLSVVMFVISVSLFAIIFTERKHIGIK